MTTARRPWLQPTSAAPAADDACELRHRPLRTLTWQLFGGFVTVVLTLALATAAHLGGKAERDDLRAFAADVRAIESHLADLRADVAELRAGQGHLKEHLLYVRETLEKERER